MNSAKANARQEAIVNEVCMDQFEPTTVIIMLDYLYRGAYNAESSPKAIPTSKPERVYDPGQGN